MKLQLAKQIAQKAKEKLAPYCDRIEIAGSIRRENPEVKDIEIVCIPKKEMQHDMFGSPLGEQVVQGFSEQVNQWEKVIGSPEGKNTQRLLPEGIILDLFMVTPENWGFQMAIRTGSAEYSHRVLGAAWKAQGYKAEGGILYSGNGRFVVREESDLFDMLGLPFVAPKFRSMEIPYVNNHNQ